MNGHEKQEQLRNIQRSINRLNRSEIERRKQFIAKKSALQTSKDRLRRSK